VTETVFDLEARQDRIGASSEKSDELALQAKNDLVTVLSTENGRRFVHRLLGEAGVFRTSFVMGDPNGTAFNEGSRNTGLRLLSRVMADAPDQYFKMLKENMSGNA
jgi:hypothetical protein